MVNRYLVTRVTCLMFTMLQLVAMNTLNILFICNYDCSIENYCDNWSVE